MKIWWIHVIVLSHGRHCQPYTYNAREKMLRYNEKDCFTIYLNLHICMYVWTRQQEVRHHYYPAVLYFFNPFFACLKMYSQIMYCNLEETVLQFLIFGLRKITIGTNKQTFTNKTNTTKLVKLFWIPSLFDYGRVFWWLEGFGGFKPPTASAQLSNAWLESPGSLARPQPPSLPRLSSVQGLAPTLQVSAAFPGSELHSYTRSHSFRLRLCPRDNPSSGSGGERRVSLAFRVTLGSPGLKPVGTHNTLTQPELFSWRLVYWLTLWFCYSWPIAHAKNGVVVVSGSQK